MLDGSALATPSREPPCALVSCGDQVISEVAAAEPRLTYGRRVTRGSVLCVTSIHQQEVQPMSGLNKLMGRGILPPVFHGVLDYPLAAVLIVLPLVLSFDDAAAKWIAFAFGIGAAVLAVGTAWPTGIIRIIPPLLHGYADVTVTVALIVLPFIVGFSDHTTALVFYLVVGVGGLGATLATRFEPGVPAGGRSDAADGCVAEAPASR